MLYVYASRIRLTNKYIYVTFKIVVALCARFVGILIKLPECSCCSVRSYYRYVHNACQVYKMIAGHDNFGTSPNWYLRMITVWNRATATHYVCWFKQWLSYPKLYRQVYCKWSYLSVCRHNAPAAHVSDVGNLATRLPVRLMPHTVLNI